jgi:AcrR family transcriptional regulator
MVTTASRIQNIPPRPAADEPSLDARERILRTAYELFRMHSTNTVGVDRIVMEAGVAKTTLYRHFRSKDDLIVAVMERHQELWTRGWFFREVQERAATPEGRLLATFDVLEEWFREDNFPGCLFINCLIETHDELSGVRAASVRGIEEVYALLRQLATEAGAADPSALAHRLQIMLRGSFVAASQGEMDAIREAKEVGRLILAHEGLENF